MAWGHEKDCKELAARLEAWPQLPGAAALANDMRSRCDEHELRCKSLLSQGKVSSWRGIDHRCQCPTCELGSLQRCHQRQASLIGRHGRARPQRVRPCSSEYRRAGAMAFAAMLNLTICNTLEPRLDATVLLGS